MSNVGSLIDQIEEAIRLDYAAKIAILEEERDGKIARVRAALADGESTPSKCPPPSRKSRLAAPPARRRREAQAEPTGKARQLSDSSRELIETILRKETEFARSEILEQFPAISNQLVDHHLRNLVARGELRKTAPGRFAPMPFNSLRNGRAPAAASVN
jgi:hypothetical protein